MREVNRILRENDVEVRDNNWQEMALEYFTIPDSPDREVLARYIAEHKAVLGVAWAKALLRLDVLFRLEVYEETVTHYERAFASYPPCPLVELWVADLIFHHLGDFWRARKMFLDVLDDLPDYAKPRYELGFMHNLLGDHPGALAWFDKAVPLISEHEKAQLGAQIYFNRGVLRYQLDNQVGGGSVPDGASSAALHDIRMALQLRPNYPRAREALFAIETGRA
jgi:tetratricopeptide (TPR) repeat protein